MTAPRRIDLPELPDAPYRTGRHVHHDPRSVAYGVTVMPMSALKTVQWQRAVPPFNQQRLGSCCGNAAAGFLVTGSAARKPATSIGSTTVDEKYAVGIYEDATHVDSVRGIYPPTDTGSTGLAVAKVLKNRGLISSYRHAFGLRATLSALQTSAVLLGTVWRDRMFYPASDGRLYPIGKDAGGHEIIIDGIDVEHQRVWMTNSWGSSFGVGGRCYLNWSDLDYLLNEHGDVTVPIP